MKKKLSELLEENQSNLQPLNEPVQQAQPMGVMGMGTFNVEEPYSVDNLKVIGVTGTIGKTSVCYLVHEYLKLLGFKSILYSSVKVESPRSFIEIGSTLEGSLSTEMDFINAINEARSYKADFIVFEVAEEALRLGAVDNIHFDVKLLTKFINGWHTEISEEDYFNNKSRFFIDDEESTCIINLSTHNFVDFYNLAVGNKIIIDSAVSEDLFYEEFHTQWRKSVLPEELQDSSLVNYSSEWAIGGIDHSYMKLNTPKGQFDINTTLATYISLSNIIMATSILDSLNVLDIENFQAFLDDPELEIEGRMQDIQFEGRTIIIDYDQFSPYVVAREMKKEFDYTRMRAKYLEEFNKEFETQEIGRIIGVASSVSSNTKFSLKWARNNPQHILYGTDPSIPLVTRTDYTYPYFSNAINTSCDKCYLTVNDPANRDPQDILRDILPFITVPTVSCPDRKQAIKRAILESQEGDLIIISGRGNRKGYMITDEEFESWRDIDIVKEAIYEFKNS